VLDLPRRDGPFLLGRRLVRAFVSAWMLRRVMMGEEQQAIWTGTPSTGFLDRRDILLIPVSLAWLAFILIWFISLPVIRQCWKL
jgi:hypothetical protein